MNTARLPFALGFLALAACGGSQPAAQAPAEPAPTTTTTTTTETPAAAATSTTTCTSADVAAVSDHEACLAKCAPLSDKAPAGSRCMPPKVECKMACDHKFKAAK